MVASILDGKRILAVDDEPDVLEVLEEEILSSCSSCQFDKATSYQTGMDKLESNVYDIVILDIMGVRGFDLLDRAVKRNFKVVMLTAHALIPEALRQCFERKARAYLPKEKLGEIVPFLEDVLMYEYLPGWKRVLEKLNDFLDEKFTPDWDAKIGLNWRRWDRGEDKP
jgi:CheY-like chemotaxis protein